MNANSQAAGYTQKLRKKNKALVRVMIALFFVILLVGCAIFSYRFAVNGGNRRGTGAEVLIPTEKQVSFEIPMGSSTAAIADLLKEKGYIRYPYIFKMMSKISGYDGGYQSGTHLIGKDLSYDELMRILTSKPVSNPEVWVTIPEGYTYKQIVDLLVSKKVIDRSKFEAVVKNEKFDYKFLEGLPQRDHFLEGYLFPETYKFEAKGKEKVVVEKMLNQFNKIFTEEFYQRAKERNMTVDQVITLASIIEREAKLPEERSMISAVFHNRLHSKDKSLRKLQSCATIQYIFFYEKGEIKERILTEDTKVENPYNTYLHEGLPPGPISSPGRDSIEAALNPDDVDYLYFVAKGDGSHQFSKTYKEHLAAVKKYEGN